MKNLNKFFGLLFVILLITVNIGLGQDVDGTWGSNANTAWYTIGNWVGGLKYAGHQGVAVSNTNIATFTSGSTGTPIGINMGTASLNLGAISVDATRTTALNITNSSGTAGVLRLYGATVNLVANVIVRNDGTGLITLQTTNTMGIVLSNATENIFQIDNTGGITVASLLSDLSGNKNLTKAGSGSGVLTLTNAGNTYSGTTTITTGELRLNPSSTPATFASQVVLNGGTLSTTNITASRVFTSSSTLKLDVSSTIALYSNVHSLKFANSSGITWAGTTLTITGWTGTTGSSGTAGKIYAGTDATGLTPSQLAKISFTGYAAGAQILSTGEIVPLPSGLTPPTLTADVTSNNVDNNIDITFTDNVAWRTAITAVKIGGTALTVTTDYVVSAGNIQLKPSGLNSLLTTSGSKSVTVEATGYDVAAVTQQIDAGSATKLVMKTQPVAPASNGALLGTQPAIYIQDQYGNTTTSTANVTATVGTGTWTLGGTTTKAGVSGTSTFTDLTATSAVSVTGATIVFSSGSLTEVTSGTFNIPAPPLTYYSQNSLAPESISNWNSVRGGGGSAPSNFTTGEIFVIQNGHNMTTSGTWSISGAGSKLQIENGGTLTANNDVTLVAATTFQIDNGGTYIQNVASTMGSKILTGTEVFGASSNFIYNFAPTGTSAPTSPGYGNLTINTPTNSGNLGWSGTITQVQGNFTIQSTGTGTTRHALTASSPDITVTVGGNFTLSGTNTNFWFSSGTATCTMNVTGDVSISESAVLDLANSSGAGTLNIGGNFSQTGGTLKSNSGVSSINFTGTGKTFTQSAGTLTNTNINWAVNSGASLSLNNDLPVATSRSLTVTGTLDCTLKVVSGAGTFTLPSGGTLKTAHTSGLNGSITVSGTKTLDAAANYEFNGISAQVTGGLLPVTVNNLTLSGTLAKTLSGSITVNGTLSMGGSASLALSSFTLTYGGSAILQYAGSSAQTSTDVEFPSLSGPNDLTIANSSGVILHADRSIGGTLNLTNGAFSIGAHTLTINGAISTTSGTLTGGSSSNISIGGSGASTTLPAVTLQNLIVNRANGISLGGDVTAENNLDLNDGVISTGSNILTLGTTSATGTLTRSTSPNKGVVYGNLKRYTKTGTNTYDFYVGYTTSHLYDARLIFTSGITDGGAITVKWVQTIAGNGPATLDDGGKTIDRMGFAGCWDISSSIITPIDYELDVNLDGLFGTISATNYGELRVIRRAGASSVWEISGNHFAATSGTYYTAKRKALSSFSQYGIGGNSATDGNSLDGPLPVSLSSLNSTIIGRNIKLNWVTSAEINNSGFNVERKLVSGTWEKVGFVQGRGTVNTPSNYSFEDRNLQTGKYNYRLKQIDNNGNFEYHNLSSIVEIGVPNKFDVSQNYPNPFNPSTKINFDLPADSKVNLLIYDVTGREVAKLLNNEFRAAGYYTAEFNASKFASGVYFYSFSTETFRITKRMMLVK